MAVDYVENVLQAIEIIADKKLRDTSFDKTIQAIVVDASKAKDGIYTVFNGGANFIAYSSETEYKENDSVMVTIPEGDYNNQKIIISKSIKGDKEDDSPLIYHSPLNNFINVSNNVISENTSASLLANKTCSWDITEDNFLNVLKDLNNNRIAQQKITANAGYTHIGLRADFSTTLGVYDVINGNYGLALVVEFAQDINEFQEETKKGENNGEIEEENEDNIDLKKAKVFLLDSSSFFGNIYNSSIGHAQEILLDISEYASNPITRISLYPYQRNNFKTINNENVDDKYSKNTLDNSINEPDNIFIKNCYVGLGIISDSFVADRAQLYTTNTNIYSQENNQKTITLSWLHKNSEQNIATAIYEDNFPKEYDINWYRYTLGAQKLDNFVGVHWEKYQNGEEWLSNQENKIMTRIFTPRQNYQREMVKVVISKNNVKIAETPILEFTNQQEVPDPNTAELLRKQAEALAIKITDDGEQGNYYVYDKAGRLMDNANKTRTLQAVYDENQPIIDYKNPLDLEGCTSIKWSFPLEGMIIPIVDLGDDNLIEINQDFLKKNNSIPNSNIEIRLEESDNVKMITIFSTTPPVDNHLISVKYKLKDHLLYPGVRSYVYLQITKDNIVCTASMAMLFNTFGTSGSGYTISIKWDNDIDYPVFNVSITNQRMTGTIILKDYNQQEISLPDTLYYKVAWDKLENLSTENTSFLNLSITKENKKDKITIYYNRALTENVIKQLMNQLYILKVSLTNFESHTLTAYFPIALKNENTNFSIQNYEGPTSIRYASDGTVNFINSPCKLNYSIINQDSQELGDDIKWKSIFFPSNTNNSIIPSGLPVFDDTSNTVLPESIYYSNLPIYGVQCFTTIDNEDIPLWTQPIYIYKYNYPSATLDEWDGNGIKIENDNEEGIIIAHGFAAGKKDENNTFSGVVLGDWSLTNSEQAITTNTGIYGFYKNDMSYAFKDDGTAFIGSDASGRIIFDGVNGYIESANFDLESQIGTRLDLKNNALYLFSDKGDLTQKETIYSLILNNDTQNNNLPLFQIGRQKNQLYYTTVLQDNVINPYINSLKELGQLVGKYFNNIKDKFNKDKKFLKVIKNDNDNNNSSLFQNSIQISWIYFDLLPYYYLATVDNEDSIKNGYFSRNSENFPSSTYSNAVEISKDKLKNFQLDSTKHFLRIANAGEQKQGKTYYRKKPDNTYEEIKDGKYPDTIYEDCYKFPYVPFIVNNFNELKPEDDEYCYYVPNEKQCYFNFITMDDIKKYINKFVEDLYWDNTNTDDNDKNLIIEKIQTMLDRDLEEDEQQSIFEQGDGQEEKIFKNNSFFSILNSNDAEKNKIYLECTFYNESENIYRLEIGDRPYETTTRFYLSKANPLKTFTIVYYDNSGQQKIWFKKQFSDKNATLSSIALQPFVPYKLQVSPNKTLSTSTAHYPGSITITRHTKWELKDGFCYINDLLINELCADTDFSQQVYNNYFSSVLSLIEKLNDSIDLIQFYNNKAQTVSYNYTDLLNNENNISIQMFSTSYDNVHDGIKIQEDYPWLPFDWENNLISLSKNGGYLTSKNYRPTMEISSNGLLKQPTDDQKWKSSDYSFYGMKGFVIDLTNDRIVLGNNSSIIGYQSDSRYGNRLREFSISIGKGYKSEQENGLDIYNSSTGDNYFIIAKEYEGPTDSIGTIIFAVDWDGNLYCKHLIQTG